MGRSICIRGLQVVANCQQAHQGIRGIQVWRIVSRRIRGMQVVANCQQTHQGIRGLKVVVDRSVCSHMYADGQMLY